MGKNGVLSYNKLVKKTRRLASRHHVPLHWSRTRNEKFDVLTIYVLFVQFQIEKKTSELYVPSFLPITMNDLVGYKFAMNTVLNPYPWYNREIAFFVYGLI